MYVYDRKVYSFYVDKGECPFVFGHSPQIFLQSSILNLEIDEFIFFRIIYVHDR